MAGILVVSGLLQFGRASGNLEASGSEEEEKLRNFSRLLLCAGLLLLFVPFAMAQQGGVASGYLGLSHSTGVNSFLFGTTDTFNVYKNFAIFGDLGIGVRSDLTSEFFDGGVMYNVKELKSGKTTLVPYILFGLGGVHSSVKVEGVSYGSTSFMMPLGGGLRVYLGRNWGIAPDFRGIIIPAGGSGVAITGQIFYDWAKK
jgi:hypothetical protein